MEIGKIFSTAFILIGIYYILVGLSILKSKIIWFNQFPELKTVAIIGVILIIVGLLLNKNFRSKLKSAI